MCISLSHCTVCSTVYSFVYMYANWKRKGNCAFSADSKQVKCCVSKITSKPTCDNCLKMSVIYNTIFVGLMEGQKNF